MLGQRWRPRTLGARRPQALVALEPIWVQITWELRSWTFPRLVWGSVFSSSGNRN